MPLNLERWEQRRYWCVIFDGWYAHDPKGGWQFMIRTPLFGFGIDYNWLGHIFTDRTNAWWIGLIARMPTEDGGMMYRWNWKRDKWTPTTLPQLLKSWIASLKEKGKQKRSEPPKSM